jgi:hypothetical protein
MYGVHVLFWLRDDRSPIHVSIEHIAKVIVVAATTSCDGNDELDGVKIAWDRGG